MTMATHPRCRCIWSTTGPTPGPTAVAWGVAEARCPNPATQEDGLCDWCAPPRARTEDQLRTNPKAVISPSGEYTGLGGAAEAHQVTDASKRPTACWFRESDRWLL